MRRKKQAELSNMIEAKVRNIFEAALTNAYQASYSVNWQNQRTLTQTQREIASALRELIRFHTGGKLSMTEVQLQKYVQECFDKHVERKHGLNWSADAPPAELGEDWELVKGSDLKSGDVVYIEAKVLRIDPAYQHVYAQPVPGSLWNAANIWTWGRENSNAARPDRGKVIRRKVKP